MLCKLQVYADDFTYDISATSAIKNAWDIKISKMATLRHTLDDIPSLHPKIVPIENFTNVNRAYSCVSSSSKASSPLVTPLSTANVGNENVAYSCVSSSSKASSTAVTPQSTANVGWLKEADCPQGFDDHMNIRDKLEYASIMALQNERIRKDAEEHNNRREAEQRRENAAKKEAIRRSDIDEALHHALTGELPQLRNLEAKCRARVERARVLAALKEANRCDNIDELRSIALRREEAQRNQTERVRSWTIQLEDARRNPGELEVIHGPHSADDKDCSPGWAVEFAVAQAEANKTVFLNSINSKLQKLKNKGLTNRQLKNKVLEYATKESIDLTSTELNILLNASTLQENQKDSLNENFVIKYAMSLRGSASIWLLLLLFGLGLTILFIQ
jgi:hypothetical protein